MSTVTISIQILETKWTSLYLSINLPVAFADAACSSHLACQETWLQCNIGVNNMNLGRRLCAGSVIFQVEQIAMNASLVCWTNPHVNAL